MIEPGHSCYRDFALTSPVMAGESEISSFDCGIPHPDGYHISFNIWEWATGDVLLTGPDDDGIGEDIITRYQRSLDPCPEHHRWWHVGLYDGRAGIYEALPGEDVVLSPVWKWAGEKTIVHRLRLKDSDIDQATFDEAVHELRGGSYNMTRQIMMLLAVRAARRGIRMPALKGNYGGDALICSVFVERVLRHVAQREIFRDVEIVTPLDFAAHPGFESVPTYWQRYAAKMT